MVSKKFVGFQAINFGRTLVVLFSSLIFGLEGSRLCEKEEEKKISVNNRKRCSIRINIDLYEVCLF